MKNKKTSHNACSPHVLMGEQTEKKVNERKISSLWIKKVWCLSMISLERELILNVEIYDIWNFIVIDFNYNSI